MPFSINPAGEVTGASIDAAFAPHGFVRDSEGAITTFDVPGALVTVPLSINPAGQVTGLYLDAAFATHGFVRAGSNVVETATGFSLAW
jgi:hypothetical protein